MSECGLGKTSLLNNHLFFQNCCIKLLCLEIEHDATIFASSACLLFAISLKLVMFHGLFLNTALLLLYIIITGGCIQTYYLLNSPCDEAILRKLNWILEGILNVIFTQITLNAISFLLLFISESFNFYNQRNRSWSLLTDMCIICVILQLAK